MNPSNPMSSWLDQTSSPNVSHIQSSGHKRRVSSKWGSQFSKTDYKEDSPEYNKA